MGGKGREKLLYLASETAKCHKLKEISAAQPAAALGSLLTLILATSNSE